MDLFGSVYKDKKVLVTGNTGFKGSWLTIWLLQMGAKVYGISRGIPSQPSNYEVCHLEDFIEHYDMDINDYPAVLRVIDEVRPDFVFHLAAQAIVKDSYVNPLETFSSNVMGTANILEALRKINHRCVGVIITSDKCYDNVEWVWGYKETDAMGGKDPYSASKGAAELIIRTYSESYFKSPSSNVKIASARAGNVIGGGDWASHRIIPDAVRSWSNNHELIIRSPNATRPWQHVLEPLSGYLLLGEQLYKNESLVGEAFNFGPKSENNFSVEQLLIEMAKFWSDVKWKSIAPETEIKEAGLLKLNCDKALFYLDWVPNLSFAATIKIVAEWYKEFYKKESNNMFDITSRQIKEYVSEAKVKAFTWTK